MGFLNDAKSNMLGTEAREAFEKGRKIFTPFLNTPVTQRNGSSSIAAWAEMIESVESEGWVLTEWSVGLDSKGRPQAYPLFRRA